jgi:hypothetical protein
MAARGHSVAVACQAGGLLETRARGAGLAGHPSERMVDGTLRSYDSLQGLIAPVGRSASPVADIRTQAGFA